MGIIMKRVKAFLAAIIVALSIFQISAYAQDIMEPPVLKAIAFNNATVEGEFSPARFEYDLMLQDESSTPTLKSYEISKDAFIFVNYELDEAKHQTAIIVDVENQNIKTSYVFNYLNAGDYQKNSNNNLAYVECYLGEVYPKLSDDNTQYSLYIPCDLTEITLSAAADDVGAYCEVPGTQYINSDQNPTININVTASDASTKNYAFKVKRINKTVEEVKEEMKQPNFSSFVQGELFYQKTEFKTIIICILGGIFIIAVLMALFKRFAIKAEDADEKEFFDIE